MKMQNKKRGFTIVELVIVIAVIAILAGVLVPTFTGIVKKAQISAAQQEATSTYHAILGTTEFAELDEAESGPDAYFLVNNGKYYVTLTDGELSEPVEIKKDVTLPENVKTTATNYDGLTVDTEYYLPVKVLTDLFEIEEEDDYTVYVYRKVTAMQKAKDAYERLENKDSYVDAEKNPDLYIGIDGYFFAIEDGVMAEETETAPCYDTVEAAFDVAEGETAPGEGTVIYLLKANTKAYLPYVITAEDVAANA